METIREIHERIAAIVGRAVNVGLTVRNWLIGWYIREYEQAGEDRATYGAALLDKLSERLVAAGFQELTPAISGFAGSSRPSIRRSGAQ